VSVRRARGAAFLNDRLLHEGDGAAIDSESKLQLGGRPTAEILAFDLA
jgi:hypothetical protein